jgi:hypothetical protein
MILVKLVIHTQKREKTETKPLPFTEYKISSKLIKDPNVSSETLKLLQGKQWKM